MSDIAERIAKLRQTLDHLPEAPRNPALCHARVALSNADFWLNAPTPKGHLDLAETYLREATDMVNCTVVVERYVDSCDFNKD